MQLTKEIPESIYILASVTPQGISAECSKCHEKLNAVIELPTAGKFCKAFTLDEAFSKMVKRYPTVKFQNLGSLTVTDFLTGCDLILRSDSPVGTDVLEVKSEEVKLTKEQQLEGMVKMLEAEGFKISRSKIKK